MEANPLRKGIKTFADLKNLWQEEQRPNEKMKAYSCLVRSEHVEFIVAAMYCPDAKDIIIYRAKMADKELSPGQIICRRRPEFDELAKQPRAARESWWLGYRWFKKGTEEFLMGCLYDG